MTGMPPPRRGLMVSAIASGQGKTTVALGLMRALSDRGVDIAPAKSGPDYIDPQFHAVATGRPCINLDAWAADPDQLRGRAAMARGETLLVEGAMGLFDGAGLSGAGSAADLAKALGIPVVIVLDAARMAHGAGALIAGLQTWDSQLNLAGAILNRVGSARHEAMLRASVERVCPVLGAIPRDPDLVLPSRHLGLVQAGEIAGIETFVDHAARAVSEHCDLAAVTAAFLPVACGTPVRRLRPPGQRIAVACDLAFSFCYQHMLDDWRSQGAEISFFSPLADQAPGAADAVFLPGGYPELHAGRIAASDRFLRGLHDAAAAGAVVYGECGGFMVLGEGMIDGHGQHHRMAGLLGLETDFQNRRRHLGYRMVRASAGPLSGSYAAHEFHYATTSRADGVPLFQAEDADGTALAPMGLQRGSVCGSFAHLIEPLD